MKILVNYQAQDKSYLSSLAYLLKAKGFMAVSTSQVLSPSELIQKAKQGLCSAILLCNESTLRQLVNNPRATLNEHRGSRINLTIPTIVCNTLSHIHALPYGEWLLSKDLDKFSSIYIPPVDPNIKVLTNQEDFSEAEAFLDSCCLIAFDIETDYLNEPEEISKDPKDIRGGDSVITCCAWSGVTEEGRIKTFVLPLIDFREDHWRTNEEYAAALLLMQRINKNDVPKVMQNGCYDALHTIRYHAEVCNWVLDTMGMAHSEYSELPRTLDFIASHTLYDYIYWKDDAEEAKKVKDIRKFWNYNAKDAFNTLRIAIQWLRKAPAYAHKNYAMQFPLVFPFLYGNFEGCLVDNKVREQVLAEAEEKLQAALSKLQTMMADPNFNPGSWQQVQKYIYKVFGAKHPKIGKSKSGTDEKNLKAVAEQHPLLAMVVEEVLAYRSNQKAIGTYFLFKQLNDRLLWSLDPFGTDSGRAACRASSLWVGTQVQNIPKYAKKMLIADEGYELFEIDNKQSEARCTAYLARDYTLAEALEGEKDFYKTLGTLFFHIPYEDVSDFFRNKVLKRIVHGTNYMMQGRTFSENIGILILYETAEALGTKLVQVPRKNHQEEMTVMAFAQSLLEVYHKPFTRIRPWYQEIATTVSLHHKLVSPLGYTRYFFGDPKKNHAVLRSAVAHEPQNLSVSLINKAVLRVYRELVIPGKGAIRFKAQIHDSIFGQYKKELRDFYLPKIQACCDNPVIVHGRELRIPTDAEYADNWGNKISYKPKIIS